MAYFTMRLVAPFATIRGPVVGDNVSAQEIPGHSFLVGMIGCALGIPRTEGARLNAMVDGMDAAYLIHRDPRVMTDFQTADLGKPHMLAPMYVNDGTRLYAIDKRGGGDKTGKTVSLRDISCDVDMTAVIEWDLDHPNATEVLAALRRPRWALSIGARWCMPSEPVAGQIIDAGSIEEAVDAATEILEQKKRPTLRKYMPVGYSTKPTADPLISVASRDFITRKHTGSYIYAVRG
jgi:CRISPR system Cascade subunit CasD